MGAACVMCTKKSSKGNPRVYINEKNYNNRKARQKVKTDEILDEEGDAPYVSPEDKAKTRDDIDFLKKSLSKSLEFNKLTEDQLDSVVSHMRYYTFQSDEIVCKQGSVGSVFFVVARGRLVVLADGKQVNELTPSHCFGEVALLHETKRTATVKTTESTQLWGVDRKTFRSTLDHLNANEYAENKNLIMSIPSFKILNNIQLESLISSVGISVYGPGQVIVTQGEVGDLLFIIKQGSVTCTEDGRITRTMEKGEYFGEKALFSHNSLRSASVTASEYVKCLTIGRSTLTDLLGSSIQVLVHKNSARIAFDKNCYLQKLTRTQYEKLLCCLQIHEKKSGEIVIHKGTAKNEQIVIILKGELVDNEGYVSFGESDIIGIEDIIQEGDEQFFLDYFAKGQVDVGLIDKKKFFEAIGGDYSRATAYNETIKALKHFEIFRNLTEDQLETLSQVLKPATFTKDFLIFTQNDQGTSMFLIISGQVDVLVNGTVVRTISKNGYFGERSLLTGDIRSATAKCLAEVSCWVLFKADFDTVFDKKLKELLYKRIELQDDSIKLTDLQIIKPIGQGTYGNVFLVAHKSRKTLFALKTVSKQKIQAYEIQENLLHERKSLLQVDHMFILKLVKTFRDENRLYFLSEYINGLTISDIQKKLKKFSLPECKFYMACILLMLEYLHEQNIVYRGLNPDNLMIDIEGYPKLIDFGTAKIIKGRTYTIVNTAYHYIAPEIIAGHGYNLSSDYWSAGILLYELLYGELPFGEEENDAYSIFESILQCKLRFPTDSDNKDKVKDLLGQLICKNSTSRLNGGLEALKGHPWFISINWEKLIRKALPTSYKPILKNINKEIDSALKQKKDINEIISEIEKNQPNPKRRAFDRVAPNWDEEFST
jgi:cGMP-dependent protein kinase